MTDLKKGESEHRQIKRISIALPVRLSGKDADGNGWDEMSRTKDVSGLGIGFTLSKKMTPGQLLRFTLAMPQQMRSFDFMEPQYNVWGIVTSCNSDEEGDSGKSFLLGARLIGKNAPESYFENPTQIYEIAKAPDGSTFHLVQSTGSGEGTSGEREIVQREHSRYQIPVNIIVGVVDSKGEITSSEATVMENVSLGGAAIFSSLNVDVGSTLHVTNDHYNANLTATVKQKRTGEDGIPRLHIEFTNGQFPLPEIDE